MSVWRRLSYSISTAVLLTAVAYPSFVPGIGEFLAVPGLILEGGLNLIILMLSRDDYQPDTHSWMAFSVLFYAVLIYVALLIYGSAKKTEGAMK